MRELAVLCCALLACGETPPANDPSDTPAPAQPAPGGIARYFPLVEGNIYHYVTENDDGQGMMITTVTRADHESGDLKGPQGVKTFQYAPDGVLVASDMALPVYVLKTPLSVGTSWRGSGGSTVEIVAVGAKITVPAGTFDDCIKTVEERGGDVPMRVETTFCADTGIVLLEVASGAVSERVSLKSYGPPVDLGGDGVRVVPDPEAEPQ